MSPAHPEVLAAGASVDASEVEAFSRIAEQWWNPRGEFAPLHRFNPTRLQFIRELALDRFGRDPRAARPFEGLRLLDIGCGGGLLSEPMTRLGFAVTGVDASARNIGVARAHADAAGLSVDYRCATAESLLEAGERPFDLVLNMEVIEHVASPSAYLRDTARLVAPGGAMVVATLNRTLKALALAKVGAEYVLRWLPRGAHDWRKFLRPEELRAFLADEPGVRMRGPVGVSYQPLTGGWRLSADSDVNYMMVVERAPAPARLEAPAAAEPFRPRPPRGTRGAMCFSAAADFTAAAAIGAVGVATLLHVRDPRTAPLAALPLLFAAHQFTEGWVWLGMDGRLGPAATHRAAWLFTLYAQSLLPMIVAPAVALVEPDAHRRLGMWAAAAVGVALGLWTAHGLWAAPLSVAVEGRCLAFRNPVTNHPWVAFVYAVPTCGAPLLSSRRVVRCFGAGALAGFAGVLAVKAYALTSVWCLVTAVLSTGLFLQFRRGAFAPAPAALTPQR